MLPWDNRQPGQQEVTDQLVRIVESPVFSRRLESAKMLSLLVNEALAGHVLQEKDIRNVLFTHKNYDPGSTLVRTRISQVRGFLDEYYEGPGQNDLVLIGLPKHKSRDGALHAAKDPYAVVFSYQHRHRDSLLLRTAKRRIARYYPAAICSALKILEEFLSRNPAHFEARLDKVECLCLIGIYVPHTLSKADAVSAANFLAAELVAERPDDYRARYAQGAALLCRRDFEAANRAFMAAAKINDDPRAKGRIWISCLAMATGSYEFALQTIERITIERADDEIAWCMYGLFLYLFRRFDHANEAFASALTCDSTCWLAELGHVFISMAAGKQDKALRIYSEMHVRLKQWSVIMPGLGGLLLERNPGNTSPILVPVAEALKALADAAPPHPDPLQIAIWLTDASPLTASMFVWTASDRADLLVYTADLWPVFEPLKDQPLFQAAVEKIRALRSALAESEVSA
jgi:hypothetical protein